MGEDDERSVADILVYLPEFADVLLVSKINLVDAEDIEKLNATLKPLNTHAKIIPITRGQVSTDDVLNTSPFDFENAKQAPGWVKEIRGDHIPETEEYGISSFSYIARRPFYPPKFYEFLFGTEQYGKLIRSKGFFWLRSRLEYASQWSQLKNYGLSILVICARN